MRSLSGRGARQSSRQNRLRLVEQFFGDQRFEVTAFATNTVLGHVHDAGVDLVAQQYADRLRCQRLAAPVRKAGVK